MAGCAAAVKSKIGFFPVLYCWIRNEFCLMAVTAGCTGMFTQQFVTCKLVIEGFLIEPDHPELPAMVVAVAFYAGLSTYLRRRMISLSSCNP
jgi:hypothetical protein